LWFGAHQNEKKWGGHERDRGTLVAGGGNLEGTTQVLENKAESQEKGCVLKLWVITKQPRFVKGGQKGK